MATPFLHTERLDLVLESTASALARIDALSPPDRAEVSPAWLARLRGVPVLDPWTRGITLVERATGAAVGSCGFTGPPDADGVVALAYGIEPAFRGRGDAREIAGAPSAYALRAGGARCVRTHRRADNAASARVLAACGFAYLEEVIDPEDGQVSRWELRRSGTVPGELPPHERLHLTGRPGPPRQVRV